MEVTVNDTFNSIEGLFSKKSTLRELKESTEVGDIGAAVANGKGCEDKINVALKSGVVGSSW